MAKKCEFNGKPAYEEGPLILQLDDENKWVVFHAKTQWLMMGPGVGPYKQKRDALAYAQALIKHLDLNFDNKDAMYEVNGGRENTLRLRSVAFYEAIDNNKE